MIIKNYGLFWKADNVFWGKQGNPTKLLGTARVANGEVVNPSEEESIQKQDEPNSSQTDWKIVNFANQIGIYTLYHDFKIIYIGQAGGGHNENGRLFARLRAHRGNYLAGRWNTFSWFGLKDVNMDFARKGDLLEFDINEKHDRQTILNHLEGILIEVTENIENRRGASFRGSVKFFQERDHRLGLTTDQMVKSIYDNNKR